MYLKHWGIDRLPFRVGLDVDSFYASSVHEEALARLEFLANNGRRLGVLLGDVGAGKSLTMQVAAQVFQRAGKQLALVDALGTSTRELFWNVANQLGATPRADDDVVQLWRRIADCVDQNRRLQIDTVLFVDDAGNAGPDLMTQLIRLTRIDPLAQARWTVVLSAQSQQAASWPAALRQLIDLRIDLVPWEEEDTAGYVQSALVDAGRYEPAFTSEALATLHEFAGGVPRQVARLADFALLAGAANGLDSVDVATVQGAAGEIEWTAAAVG